MGGSDYFEGFQAGSCIRWYSAAWPCATADGFGQVNLKNIDTSHILKCSFTPFIYQMISYGLHLPNDTLSIV
jgi:hypothetical protein